MGDLNYFRVLVKEYLQIDDMTVASIQVFAFSIVLVDAIAHVHVYSASGSHSAILNAGCDGLGHHCTLSNP